jgi:anti-sigma regulatory factor (Ser/Thr protein kinase)
MIPAEASWPPAGARDLCRWVLDDPAELRTLRSSLVEAITGRAPGLHLAVSAALGDVAETMVVIATELATNALRHGLPPTIVRLGRTDQVFVLDVADHSPEAVPEYADDRPPGAGGLGLHLAKQFALDLGWYTEDNTKHVWAEFPVQS